jgi:hypothetical protein
LNNAYLYERLAIHDRLCHFQSAFDLQDWQLMDQCLWPELHVDYSSFRNDSPRFMSSGEYIALRQAALSELRMQHNFSNLLVTVSENEASARCNYTILRFRTVDCTSEADFFHSSGRYYFDLKKHDGQWRICGIRQELIANHGTPGLHKGIIPKPA